MAVAPVEGARHIGSALARGFRGIVAGEARGAAGVLEALQMPSIRSAIEAGDAAGALSQLGTQLLGARTSVGQLAQAGGRAGLRTGHRGVHTLQVASATGHLDAVFTRTRSFRPSERRLAADLVQHVDYEMARIREAATLRRHAEFDALTGIRNRRVTLEALDSTIAGTRAGDHAGSVAMFDIDHFKSVNDTYGHGVGDVALQHVARVLDDEARAVGGTAGRLGGEEFALVLPGRGVDDGAAIVEQVLERLRTSPIDLGDGTTLRITSSAGLASIDDAVRSGGGSSDVLRAADDLLYEAKASGRDRLVVAPAVR